MAETLSPMRASQGKRVSTSPQIPHRSRPPLPFPAPRPRNNPLELWHLLSLDAPTVAALWTWSIARTNHLHLPATSIAAMAVAVWLLYAADRLLDARSIGSTHPTATLEPRHLFHHRHRRAFLAGIIAASVLLAALLPHLTPAAIHLYLIEGSVLVGYFVLIHATSSAHRLPKELAVGLFFAAATFIPTVAREPLLRLPLLAPAILFSALCTLNCVFIYAWEHPLDPTAPYAGTHTITRIALHHLKSFATLLVAASVALCLATRGPIPAAIALATLLLMLLHALRKRTSPTTLRAAADLALLTPIFFLFF